MQRVHLSFGALVLLVVSSTAVAACGSSSSGVVDAGWVLLSDGGSIVEDGGGLDDGGGAILADGGMGEADGGPRADGGVSIDGGPIDGGTGCPLPARDGGPLNPSWIGGPCTRDQDCNFDGGVCLTAAEGFPGGSCSQACTTTCPDLAGADNTVTFCINGRGRLAGSGMCVSKCDFTRAPLGCRNGYACDRGERHSMTATLANVCVPGEPTCYAQASGLCINYRASANPFDKPSECPNEQCSVENAMTVTGPINGIVWRNAVSGNVTPLYMSCSMSLALYRLGAILRDMGAVEASHIGTYNCRQIAGTNCTLSQHSFGNAIDLGSFKLADGGVISVLNHWEPQQSIPIEPSTANRCRFNYTPTTEKGRWLYDFAYRMCDERLWSIILTPNYNAAHDNHFHVDLTEGYSRPFLGHPGPTTLRPNTQRE